MAKALEERNVAKDDCARLYEMMELLKSKYQTLTEQKAAQAQELIDSETEKLKTARALIELKLEHSQLRESSENERFDLSTALLNEKNRSAEMDLQLKDLGEQLGILKKSLSDCELNLMNEEKTSASLRATLAEVRDTLDRERSKNLDLGTELLTLVNQRYFIYLYPFPIYLTPSF